MSYKLEFVGREPTVIQVQSKGNPLPSIKPINHQYEIKKLEDQIQHLQIKLQKSKDNLEKLCKHKFTEYERGCDKCQKCGKKEYFVYTC